MINKHGLFAAVFLVLAASLFLTGTSMAAVQYLGDGAVQNNSGGWDLPKQGTCPADLTKTTRPECLSLRLNLNQAACTPTGSMYTWTTSGVCNDLVNNTQVTCQAHPDRFWNAGTSVCAVVMEDDDRNNVNCALHGGNWVTTGTCTGGWVMPLRNDPAYGASGLYTSDSTSGSGAGAGDQCLRCHNSETQYNGVRIRDVEDFLLTGHKNMSRKVAVGKPWGGPAFMCVGFPAVTDEEACEAAHGGVHGFWVPATPYPSDDAHNPIDWTNGNIKVFSCSNTTYTNEPDCTSHGASWTGTTYPLYWIYADWLSPNPRAIYNAGSNAGTGKPLMSYSCARCHTTGWTSDSAIGPSTGNLAKEPEKSYPGVTWDGTTLNTTGKVNLAGGVTGDTNKYASWDYWGISCTRCHSSAVDNTTNSGVPPYTSPSGMSTHHSDVTGPTVSTSGDKGYCTDSRFTARAQCDAAGAAWLTQCSIAGICSNPSYTTSGTCAAALATWTPYVDSGACTTGGGTWGAAGSCSLVGVCNRGTCSNATYKNQNECTANGATWTGYADQATCEYAPAAPVIALGAAGSSVTNGTHTVKVSYVLPTGESNVSPASNVVTVAANEAISVPVLAGPAGCTNVNVYMTVAGNTGNYLLVASKGDCLAGTYSITVADGSLGAAVGGQAQWAAATDIVRCLDAGGKYTGNKTNRGQIITSLCMNCHRQETGGKPFEEATGIAAVPRNMAVTVAPYHETISFPSHPHGNMFLASTHGGFTGTFSQIPTAKYGSGYSSYFQNDGEAAKTGNGCTGCHDPHGSVVAGTGTEAIHEECQECHNKNLTKMLSRHPGGIGTPLEFMASDPAKACETCHMPDAQHFFRINTNASYSTFPTAVFGTYANSGACQTAGGTFYSNGTCYFNANTAADGSFANAVWVDMDHACGQCHGGGTAYKVTKGTIAAGSKVLTVTDATGLATGEKIAIAGAGAIAYCSDANYQTQATCTAAGKTWTPSADFETYISSVAGTTVNLVGKASTTVSAAVVTQNPLKNGAGWISRTNLAGFAKGMHNDAPVVTFSWQRDAANSMQINVNASATTCNVTCNVYSWNWGDGTTTTGVTSSHVYAVAGTYPVTLTVTEYGVGTSSKTQNVTAVKADNPPTIGGSTCADIWSDTALNTWTASVVDASTDDGSIFTVRVTWGDGSLTENKPAGSTFGPHTYAGPGTYTITRKVYDNLMQETTQTCTATLTRFAIKGTVKTAIGTDLPVSGATLKVVGSAYSKTLLSLADGSFSFANLKPGTYTLTVAKTGRTFTGSPFTINVGPNSNVVYRSVEP